MVPGTSEISTKILQTSCKLSLFLDKTKFIKSDMLNSMIHSAHINISYRSINRFVIGDPNSDFSVITLTRRFKYRSNDNNSPKD